MIDNVRIEKLTEPRFVEPLRIFYTEDGVDKSWEMIRAHDSVAILIYDSDLDSFAIVKQFRPAVFLRNDDGFTYELCAGILDKNKSEELTAIEEIEEETGYKITVDRLEKIASYYTVGFAGSRQTLFFASVRQSERHGEGGGIDTEKIEAIFLPLDEARTFIYDETRVKTSSLAFALFWFFERERGKYA
ncbi:MAG: NUDIX domain-containing protein [Helicobacteraceae bacterium]|jgi:UDP-sugar diphosphatase|nr:NUDIX domain-containing protein [Helicobacteraceae bacterium]